MSLFSQRGRDALLVIDAQEAVLGEAINVPAVAAAIADVVDQARACGVTVIWVQHSGPGRASRPVATAGRSVTC